MEQPKVPNFQKLMQAKLAEMLHAETNIVQSCVKALMDCGAKAKQIKIHRSKDTTTTHVFDKVTKLGYLVERVLDGTQLKFTATPYNFNGTVEQRQGCCLSNSKKKEKITV